MARVVTPSNSPRPASAYAQGVVHSLAGERLVIAGQIGVTADGKVVAGLEGQIEQAWRNLFAALDAAGFERRHLVRLTVYMTRNEVALYRAARDRVLQGHLCATTFVVVSGLATPELLFEIEGEAVKEA